mgnify:CR=1 FL=1
MAILGVGKQSAMIFFNWPDVATALLKQRGIHTGWWKVGLQFEQHGGNFKVPTSKTHFQLVPGVVSTIVNINLTEVSEDHVDPLCVDAAVVNPRQNIIVPSVH